MFQQCIQKFLNKLTQVRFHGIMGGSSLAHAIHVPIGAIDRLVPCGTGVDTHTHTDDPPKHVADRHVVFLAPRHLHLHCIQPPASRYKTPPGFRIYSPAGEPFASHAWCRRVPHCRLRVAAGGPLRCEKVLRRWPQLPRQFLAEAGDGCVENRKL